MATFKDKCFHQKKKGVYNHIHCKLTSTDKAYHVKSWNDIGQLPSIAVLQKTYNELKKVSEENQKSIKTGTFPAVQWRTNLNQILTYTEKDLRLLLSLLKYFQRIKKSVKKEILMNSEDILPPNDFQDIARQEACSKFYKLIWHSPITIQSIDVSGVNSTSMLEALAVANRRTCIDQLDTDTLSILADPSGWADNELMSWFVDLCNINISKNTYILLDTALRLQFNKVLLISKLNLSGDDRWIFIPSVLGILNQL